MQEVERSEQAIVGEMDVANVLTIGRPPVVEDVLGRERVSHTATI